MRAPENAAFMGSVGVGECPRELEPPVQGQQVNVNLVRGQGPYVPPPTPAYTAFAGTARTLTGASLFGSSVGFLPRFFPGTSKISRLSHL